MDLDQQKKKQKIKLKYLKVGQKFTIFYGKDLVQGEYLRSVPAIEDPEPMTIDQCVAFGPGPTN
jgi:hypothetical protein